MDFVIGFQFLPTEVEIVSYFLPNFINGEKDIGNGLISVADDVYSKEPESLFYNTHYLHPYATQGQERFFFVKWTASSNKPNAKRARRTVKFEDEKGSCTGGYWHSSTADKPIIDEENGGVTVGFKKMLNFYRYKDENRLRKEAVKTHWIMHEYKISNDRFQEWVLCGIKFNNNSHAKQENLLESGSSSNIFQHVNLSIMPQEQFKVNDDADADDDKSFMQMLEDELEQE